MTNSAILFMVVVCGVVWGGFITLLTRAVRSEGHKSSESQNR